METPQAPTEELRGKTDKSLEDERGKTDEYLDKQRQKVEDDTSETIRLSRAAADKTRESKRAEADSDKVDQGVDEAGEKSLIQERAVSDKAQKVERQDEDRARAKERFQKRLIAEALLEDERNETDSNLLDERYRLDADTEFTKAALVTRDHFLAIVSHDLRNPLNVISLGTGLLRRLLSKDEIDKAALLKNVDIVERSADHMERMISDLLDVERMSNNKLVLNPEKVDLCALLQECKDLFAPVLLAKSHTMNIQTCSEPVFATVDHDRILQVLSNLIGNALKFTPSGGAIGLSVQRRGNEVEILVEDNGPGMTEEKKALVFERFSQLKTNDRRGLGLGLYISKWIVEAHKGHISADSKVGKGSVFRFTLPG